ncbi:RNA-directed DNA polymerase [Enterococcus pseudoavium]|uniref:RNA-directed DNA polymerase n=1 Tax=Enterococcus pseudoavium TaxID=44007 RepID=A0AAE4I3E9_9ENTE|nr:RNA-directed DNA polymerase [Enterococcus pseudoavium]MDT2738188.1 RNA-directed DNA polymerase [Enterococcus pseudoavium]
MISINKELEIIVEQFASSYLPPFLDCFSGTEQFLKKISKNEIDIFKRSKSEIYVSIDKSKINIPKYIYNKGAESIKYFSFKNDLSKRPMGIANPLWFFCFAYNIIMAEIDWIEDFYHNDENASRYLFHSNSPILGRENISRFEYDDQDNILIKERLSGFVNEKQMNVAFNKNKEKTMRIEGTNPLFMQTDIESYYQNIYTHQLSMLSDREPYNSIANKKDSLKEFFSFLDEYNMGINDNHTKGILQGPISSSISAEFLGVHLDYMIQVDNPDVAFVRYVDDFTFFSTDASDLEKQIEVLDRTFRKMGLARKVEKTHIDKGFPPSKEADLNNILYYFPFLDEKKDIHQLNDEDISSLRTYIFRLVQEERVPQIRALLTMLRKYVDKNYEANKMHIKQSIYLVPLLLKLEYSFPIVSTHVNRLITSICNRSEKKELKRIINILIDNIDYVESHYAETEIQIWHYYVITSFCTANLRKQLLRKVLKRSKKDPHSTDPIILSFFVKSNCTENYAIYSYVKSYYMACCGYDMKSTNLKGIGSSAWWLVFVRLYQYVKRQQKQLSIKGIKPNEEFKRMSKKVNQLFVTKNKPNYSELGIFIDLLNGGGAK